MLCDVMLQHGQRLSVILFPAFAVNVPYEQIRPPDLKLYSNINLPRMNIHFPSIQMIAAQSQQFEIIVGNGMEGIEQIPFLCHR